jgi:hypothetical protein
MQIVSHLRLRVQPARRRSLAAFAGLALAPPAPILPFAVGKPPRPRAPKGGVTIGARFYRAGSYLPATAEPASPAQVPTANPRDGWPAWTGEDRWTIATDDDAAEDGPRPEPATFAPSVDEEANAMGYGLVMAGEDPVPPRGWAYSRLVAFFDGVMAAWTKLEHDRIDREEYHAWLDSLPRPEIDVPYAELVEAVGCIAASNPLFA